MYTILTFLFKLATNHHTFSLDFLDKRNLPLNCDTAIKYYLLDNVGLENVFFWVSEGGGGGGGGANIEHFIFHITYKSLEIKKGGK